MGRHRFRGGHMGKKRSVKKTGGRLLLAYALRGLVTGAALVIILVLLFTLKAAFLEGDKTDDSDNKDTEEAWVRNDTEWETDASQQLPQAVKKVTVMVDAGHGGNDPGTSSGAVDEKDVVLVLAKLVKSYLEESGVTVILSREDDTFIDKYERAEMANEAGADLFVSIHCNYLEERTDISGVETYYMENSQDGERLATLVHNQILSITGANDMYVRTNDYVVIRETNMPAILVETGYLSNKEDEQRLISQEYQAKMAYGIAAGIIEYINSESE